MSTSKRELEVGPVSIAYLLSSHINTFESGKEVVSTPAKNMANVVSVNAEEDA